MKIQIVSDLHTEFHDDGGTKLVQQLIDAKDDADILIIAGDIGNIRAVKQGPLFLSSVEILKMLSNHWDHVVFCLGNHDYYHSDILTVHTQMAELCQEIPNLHWLNKERVVINNQGFIGCTMWFKEPRGHMALRRKMTDFHAIFKIEDWVFSRNRESVMFLENNTKQGDIVVTHHMPSERCVAPRFVGSMINCYFVCDVEHVMKKCRPKMWIHGHTHDCFDFMLHDARIVCNPFGYIHEQNWRNGFEFGKIIDLEENWP